jgi:hypothetical protein
MLFISAAGFSRFREKASVSGQAGCRRGLPAPPMLIGANRVGLVTTR